MWKYWKYTQAPRDKGLAKISASSRDRHIDIEAYTGSEYGVIQKDSMALSETLEINLMSAYLIALSTLPQYRLLRHEHSQALK